MNDGDLEDVSVLLPVGSYFQIDEFDAYITPIGLFNVLPEPIKSRYAVDADVSMEQLVQTLNQILEQYDLIETVVAFHQTSLTPDELSTLSGSIKSLELNTLVLVNRMFLTDIFAEYCPPVQKSSDDVAYILPLLNCIISGEEEPIDDISGSRAVAASYNAYISQRNALKSKFSQYKTMTVPQITLSKNSYGTTINLQIGIYGVVQNNWGSSIKFSISAAAFIQAESPQAIISKTETVELLPTKRLANLNVANFSIGPVVIVIKCPLDIGLKAELSGSIPGTPLFVGFTGLYGAGGYIGADYGISWKKLLFIPYPSGFYFNPYVGTEVINDFTCYAGLASSTLYESILPSTASASFILIPFFTFGPDISLWSLIHAKIETEATLRGKLSIQQLPNSPQLITQKKKSTKGVVSLEGTGNFYFTGSVGIDETILGIRIKFDHKFNRIPLSKTLTTGEFLKLQIW